MGSFNLKPMTFEFQKKIPESAMGLNIQTQSPLTQGLYSNKTYTNYQINGDNADQQKEVNKANFAVAKATGKPLLGKIANQDLSFKNEDWNKDGKIGYGVNTPSIDDPEKQKNDNINKAFNSASRVLAAGIRAGFKNANKTPVREFNTMARPRGYQEGGGLLKQPALTGVSVPAATIPQSSVPGNIQPIAMDEKTSKKTERKARAIQAGKSFKQMALDKMDAIGESLEKGITGIQKANQAEGQRSAAFREKIKTNRPEMKSIWNNNPNDPQNIKSAAAAFNRGGRLSILQELLK